MLCGVQATLGNHQRTLAGRRERETLAYIAAVTAVSVTACGALMHIPCHRDTFVMSGSFLRTS